jgi:hypothetical protein
MPIDATEFGSITVDGKTYEHDLIIRLSGKVEKRRKRFSKEKYGTSHIISKGGSQVRVRGRLRSFDRGGRPGRERAIVS